MGCASTLYGKETDNPARDDIIIAMQPKSYPNPRRGGIINGGGWYVVCDSGMRYVVKSSVIPTRKSVNLSQHVVADLLLRSR